MTKETTKLAEKIDKKIDDIYPLDSSISVENNKIRVQISEKEENNLFLEPDGLFIKKPEEYSIVKNKFVFFEISSSKKES